MKYIGRYKETANYSDIISDISFLSTAEHLEFLRMFVFETDDEDLVAQIRDHDSVMYVHEDREEYSVNYNPEYIKENGFTYKGIGR